MQRLGGRDRREELGDPVLEGAVDDEPDRDDEERGEVAKRGEPECVARHWSCLVAQRRTPPIASRTPSEATSSTTDTAAAPVTLSLSIWPKM